MTPFDGYKSSIRITSGCILPDSVEKSKWSPRIIGGARIEYESWLIG
jgi:hypothetical protein